MATVFVTGANGFIGKALVERLAGLGFAVKALVRAGRLTDAIESPGVTVVRGDLGNQALLREGIEGADYVVHAAALISAPRPDLYYAVNEGGTETLLQACSDLRQPLQRFILISSQAAGGPGPHEAPRRESDPDSPISDYGRSKLAAEGLFSRLRPPFPYTILRPSMVYGPGERNLARLAKFIRLGVVPGFGQADRTARFSFVSREDVLDAILLCLKQPASSSGETYYLAENQPHTLAEYAALIAEAMGTSYLRLPVPDWAISLATRAFPQKFSGFQNLRYGNWMCSAEKAGRMLGFSPKRELSREIRSIVQATIRSV